MKTASQLLIAETFKAEMSPSDTVILLTTQFLLDATGWEKGNVNMEDINLIRPSLSPWSMTMTMNITMNMTMTVQLFHQPNFFP